MTDETLSVLLKRASLDFDKFANQYLQVYQLSNTQFKILKYLYRKPVLTVTQKELEIYFSMTNPTVTGVLQNLEKKGYLYRQPNPADARSKVIALTDKALGFREKLLALGQDMDEQFTQALSSLEKEQLSYCLQKLLGGKHANS
ncbi:MarR family winged helix-turn-helix transcriptional regulator [Streptococcus dentiloxodontae]